MMVVLPATHPLGHQASVRSEPFIMSTGGCEPLITTACRAAGVAPQTQFAVREMHTILTMGQEGLGVTIVPELALRSMLHAVCIRALAPPVQREIGIVVRSRAHTSPAVQAFVDYAQCWVKTHGYTKQ